jgi:hypothetical protein
VKPEAVRGRVVEAVLLAMREIAIVFETCVSRDLLTQVTHAIENLRHHMTLLDVWPGPQLEGAFAHRAIVIEQIGEELGGRFLLTIPLDTERAVDLGPPRAEPGQFGEQRDVGLVEELCVIVKSLDDSFEAGAHIPELHQTALEAHTLLLCLRRYLGPETELRRLPVRVGGVA